MNAAAESIVDGLRVGDVLEGKYRVVRILGQGGMGVVALAHHVHLDERVAIKCLLAEAMRQPGAVERFAREARAAVRIKSEHVARVSDVGTLPNGAPYMVMEFLEGLDLSDWLEQRGCLPVPQAVDFVVQACDAIADAHSIGIIHRDLKPANLFCIRRNDGELSIKVLDFGISKVTAGAGADHSMTATTAVMGSPYYMSPEQIRSARSVDAGTDLWSLGVILYQLLTNAVPFNGETLMELAVSISTAEPERLGALRADVPRDLEATVHRCLAKERAARFANVAELAAALAPFGTERAQAVARRIARVLAVPGRSSSAPPEAGGVVLGETVPIVDAAPAERGASAPPVAPRSDAPVAAGPSSAPDRASAEAPPVGTVSAWGRTRGNARPGRRWWPLPLAVGVVVFAALVAAGTALRRAQPVAAPAAAAESGVEPTAAAAESPAPLAPERPVEEPEDPVEAIPVSALPVAPSEATVAPAWRPALPAREPESGWKSRDVAATSPPAVPDREPVTGRSSIPVDSDPYDDAPAAAEVSCTPNFYLDAQGRKHFKPQCFR